MSEPWHPSTALLTKHARERAAEMGVCTKRIKRLLRNPTINRVGRDGRWVATSQADPDIAVVYAPDEQGRPVVITLLWRAAEAYDRATYRPSA